MTDSNRVQLAHVRESTLGTTPNTPRMRKARFTGESLAFQPAFVQSQEIRDDRMNSDPIKVNETHQGAINGELSFPVDNSPFSDWLESLLCNEWVNTPVRENDGTADSVITAVTASSDTYTVTDTGADFVTGMLVLASGFANAGNNGLVRAESGSSGTALVVPASPGLTDEAAPGASARLKVVGLQGASGDLVAAADGITSTALNFTTLGLAVGQWIKVGGTGSDFRFATAACNGWARITAIAAGKLTLDNLPSGWTTDAGTGKTLRIWFGDQLKNGVLTLGQTIERGFLGQQTPVYIHEEGMVVGQGEFSFPFDNVATWTLNFMGMTGGIATSPLDASPDDATTAGIMAAGVNVGRIAENGAVLTGPNFVRSLTIGVQNTLRAQGAIRGDGQVGAIGIGKGSCDVTVTAETYFGSDALLTKLFAGSPTNLNARLTKASQAIIYGIPRITFTEGAPAAGAKNQDVMLNLTSMASKDTLTSSQILLDRLEYFEA